MNFGDVDWAAVFVLVLGMTLLVGGSFMLCRAVGVMVIGLLLIFGALVSSRRVG